MRAVSTLLTGFFLGVTWLVPALPTANQVPNEVLRKYIAIREESSSYSLIRRVFPNQKNLPVIPSDPALTTITRIPIIGEEELEVNVRHERSFTQNFNVQTVPSDSVGRTAVMAVIASLARTSGNSTPVVRRFRINFSGNDPNTGRVRFFPMIARVQVTPHSGTWENAFNTVGGEDNFRQAFEAALGRALSSNSQTSSYAVVFPSDVGGLPFEQQVATVEVRWEVADPTPGTTIGRLPDGL